MFAVWEEVRRSRAGISMPLWSVVYEPVSLHFLCQRCFREGRVSVPRRSDLVNMKMEDTVLCELRERFVIRHAGYKL